MSRLLLPVTPIRGHVEPMLRIGAALRARGHDVTVLTGPAYAASVARAGLAYRPVRGGVDEDGSLVRRAPASGPVGRLRAARRDVLTLFVSRLVDQHRALARELARRPYDAVVAETGYLGALPLAQAPAATRPPVLGVSTTPLSVLSSDVPHFGSGLPVDDTRRPHIRRRNRRINALLRLGPLGPVQAAFVTALIDCDVPALAAAALDYFDHTTAFDATLHLCAPALEYPRSELPATVRCVGPLREDRAEPFTPPPWWGDVERARRVVHVTQGTLDNTDVTRLLVPALRALGGGDPRDLLVVATTGGRPVEAVRRHLGGEAGAPRHEQVGGSGRALGLGDDLDPRRLGNVRLADHLPYAHLLPHVDVVVTNGGFGGVQRALAHGIPLVVAGATEDKPEIAARVAWSGAGIDLRTGVPRAGALRRAVRRALDEPRYARAAGRIAAQVAALPDPVDVLEGAVRDALCEALPEASPGMYRSAVARGEGAPIG